MNIFNFIRNKTKAFPTLISDFGREQGFLTLRNFIDDGRIFKYIDKSEPENIEKLITLEALLNARPKTGIVGVRYLKESGRLIFVVGECFDNIKTLTEILNLPCGPENYLERVKLRREYIDSRLKENPSEVFWDYPDYFGGRNDRNPEERHVLQTLTDVKVNSNGVLVTNLNNVLGLFRDGDDQEKKRNKYMDVQRKIEDTTGVVKIRTIRRSRLVACTFVRMSPEIESKFKEDPGINIVPDHLNMNKLDDRYTNFEWVTRKDNTVRGLKGTDKIKYYLISIVKGSRAGENFTVYGIDEAKKAGLNRDAINRGRDKVYIGVTVKIITKEESMQYQRGFDDPSYFDQFKNLDMVGTNKQVQYYYTPLIGPFKGTEFKITGNDLESVFKRKRFRIQRLETINLGGIWRFESGLDQAENDYPKGLISWLERERNFIMANDMLITKTPASGDISKVEIGPLISFFTEGINQRSLKDHISGRSPTYKGFIYKRVSLEEARTLGFEY